MAQKTPKTQYRCGICGEFGHNVRTCAEKPAKSSTGGRRAQKKGAEKITRVNAGRIERETSTTDMLEFENKYKALIEKVVGSPYKATDQSTKRKNRGDWIFSGPKGALIIEHKKSGVGTDLNTTFNQLEEKGVFGFQNSNIIKSEYRADRLHLLRNFIKKNKSNTEYAILIDSLEEVMPINSKLEDFLDKVVRKQYLELYSQIKNLWKRYNKLEVVVSTTYIKALYELLPNNRYAITPNKEKVWTEKISFENFTELFAKSTTKVVDGTTWTVKDINGKNLVWLRQHWKNGTGCKTFACNGWVANELFYEEVK